MKPTKIIIPRSDVVRYWYEDLKNKNNYIHDIGEPHCWACGHWGSTRHDCKNIHATNYECYQIWNKVGHLQVCHIVPHSLGGTDDFSNLFLMCKKCHELAPDTVYPDLFFEWVKSQNYFERTEKEFRENCEIYGIEINDNIRIIINSNEFINFVRDKLGRHRSIYGGSILKASTRIALLKKYIEIHNIK